MSGFVHDIRDLDPADTARFGGKACGLARMVGLGLPVPPAFAIDTHACRLTGEQGGRLPDDLDAQVSAALSTLEDQVGRRFAAEQGPPLLVSVRSGAKVSMPGMMDTVLNLGLDRPGALRLAEEAQSAEFAVDTWLRFWAMYADIVLDVDPELLRASVEPARAAAAADLNADSAAAFETAVAQFLEEEGEEAPLDPRAQLDGAIAAVFRSWDSRRAKAYRAHHGIPDDLGTAVVVQAMVFGNLGADSGSGVAFTRDPKTGVNELYGEYLESGQGEEVVAGTRTPVSLHDPDPRWLAMKSELEGYGRILEKEYADALDIEFTVQGGTLYLLQVRPAKRTAAAAVQIASEMLADGAITAEMALARVSAEQVRRLVSPQFDASAVAAAEDNGDLLVTGIGASPGHGSGQAALDADRAEATAAQGIDAVLVRPTTSPQDLRGMLAATAVLTERGGSTSHAAVVSRALDKPCVVGAKDIEVRPDDGVFIIDGVEYAEGTEISVDGSTGKVYRGILPRSVPETGSRALAQLLTVADAQSQATAWTRVGLPSAVAAAVGRGATGIGVIGLTDLLGQSPGAVDRLIAAIKAISEDEGAPREKVEDLLVEDVRAAVGAIQRAAGDVPIDIRLPILTSSRARRLIDEWASLAPHLLLPLGPQRILTSYLTAIGGAVADTGHRATTVLIGGVTHAYEVDAFAAMVEEIGGAAGLRAGAVLSNPAVLFRPEDLVADDRTLWVDLHELSRSAHGYPEELLFTIQELTEAGAAAAKVPGERLNPMVGYLVRSLIEAAAGKGRVGVDLAGAAPAGVAPDLYALGFRHFTSVAGGAEELRLLLGQAAVGS